MRHGHRSRIEGNFFFGGGGRRTAGIRLHGTGHVVVNNYLEGLGQFGLSLPAGQSRYEATGYEPTIDCTIAHNTIVDARGPAVLIGGNRGSDGCDTPPSGTAFVNNLITGSQAKMVDELFTGPARWVGNILFARPPAMAGIGPREGVTVADAKLERAPDGLWRPLPGSPAVGKAARWTMPAVNDIDGQRRSVPGDVGADERSEEPVVYRPLLAADVGPRWMR